MNSVNEHLWLRGTAGYVTQARNIRCMGLIVLLVVGSTLVGGEWVTSFCFSEVV
jgi:hypothetical protein